VISMSYKSLLLPALVLVVAPLTAIGLFVLLGLD
jgi:hypothetical protein